jgi:hypothetical protein
VRPLLVEPAAASVGKSPPGRAPQDDAPARPEQGAAPSAPSEGAQSATQPDESQAPPQRAKRSEPGQVLLGVVGGWADVFLGNRRLGTTPLVVSLPAGTHTLTLYPFGKPPALRSRVEVRPGERTKHKVTLAAGR